MRPDAGLRERLGAFPSVAFAGETFRVTRRALHPLIPSRSGGRWAPQGGPAVLYTSTEPAGALAEIAFHLSLFTPLPSKPVALHRIGLSTGRTLRLVRANLIDLGIDWDRYGETDYRRTQEIGAALAEGGYDGLLAPSARWPCENLMLFVDSQAPGSRLEVLSTEEIDWVAWARANGLLSASHLEG